MALFSRRSSGKSIVGGAVIFVIATIAGFVMGVMGLTGEKKSLDEAFSTGISAGEIVSGVPAYGSNQYVLKVKHTVRSIPVGNDYYFYIASEDEEDVLAVRASKDFGSNFDGEYSNSKNIKIKGKVKRMSYDVRNSLSGGSGYGDDYYIDLLSSRMSILWLIAGSLGLLCIILFVLLNMKKKNDDFFGETAAAKAIGGIIFAGFVAMGLILIYVCAHM